MAKIIGTSEAWDTVQKELLWINLYPENLSDISKFLKIENEKYEETKKEGGREIQNNLTIYEEKLRRFNDDFDAAVKQCKYLTATEIKLAQLEIQLFQGQNGFIRKIRNHFKINKITRRIHLLHKRYKKCQKGAERKFSSQQKTLENFQKDCEIAVQNKIRESENKVMLLKTILSSPEYAGAVAEIDLIKKLASLPDNFYVINNVKLSLDKAIRFDDAWLKTAQIDHLVITPAGMFVIEVKNWSSEFIENGDFFNPYEQVKRASYLCYKLIGERYNIKARSILAHTGNIPEKPKGSYVKVLSISEVKSYILWFKEQVISDYDINTIANKFTF